MYIIIFTYIHIYIHVYNYIGFDRADLGFDLDRERERKLRALLGEDGLALFPA